MLPTMHCAICLYPADAYGPIVMTPDGLAHMKCDAARKAKPAQHLVVECDTVGNEMFRVVFTPTPTLRKEAPEKPEGFFPGLGYNPHPEGDQDDL